MTSSTEAIAKEYAKRPGTSGVRGHLYETKLLSLIYFKAIHNDRMEEFHLATNVDKLGSFDDICFRAKVKGFDQPISVFIQAKHRENNSILKLSQSDLVDYFNSYLEIRHKFQLNNEDVLFEGTFSETNCLFVIYTTAKGDEGTKKYEGALAEYLNDLISTGDSGKQSSHDDSNIQALCKSVLEKHMTALARQIAKCIYEEFNEIPMLMQDEHVLRYHVILAQKVFEISDVKPEGHRLARFRSEFIAEYSVSDKILSLFREELCTEIFRRQTCKNDNEQLKSLTTLILEHKSSMREQGKEVNNVFLNTDILSRNFVITHEEIAFSINVKECLQSLEFKVPASFGNKDLTIKGGETRIERKLNDLKSKIIGLIDKSKPSNVIVIDESVGKGFIQLSGGIASAVGNLLIADGTTELIKFNDNYESLGKLAKVLYDKLTGEIDNLWEYRFDVKVEIFPKLSFNFDEYSKNIVNDFLSKLLFFTSQSNEKQVEETLIYEINSSVCDDVQNADVVSDAIFLKYHDEVQKWWLAPKVGKYLTKDSNIYEKAVKQATNRLLISVISTMLRIKNKNYTFSEAAINSIKLDDQPSGTIIITVNRALTVAKFTTYLNNKDCAMIDLEYILNLSPRDDKILRAELSNTNEVKTLIIVFDIALITTRFIKKLENIVNSIENKKVILITDKKSIESAKKYFSQSVHTVIKDLRNNLTDMSEESQENILDNTKVMFQSNEISLREVLVNNSSEYVGGDVLYKIMQSDKNIIGKPLYDQPKYYIERAIKCCQVVIDNNEIIRSDTRAENLRFSTLNDITDDDVLLIGSSGMGKSTLLTHLSLKTKELDPSIWILRINLLDYSTKFAEWQKKNTVIDTSETLKFMCQVALSEESSKKANQNITLEEYNNLVLLKDCTGDADAWTVFELKLFLHYYNTKKLIVLLDGFDEICPTYVSEALALVKTVKKLSQRPKMWITSRSYYKLNTILELGLNTFYEICPMTDNDQQSYLFKFWDDKKILDGLYDYDNRDRLSNIYDFITFLSLNHDIRDQAKKNKEQVPKKIMPLLPVFKFFIKYLKLRRVLCPMKTLDKLCKIFYRKQVHKTNSVPTPLHLNIISDYLYTRITEYRIHPSMWDLETNMFKILQDYMKTKLKNIRFQKTGNDMSKPDNILAYDTIYAQFKVKHNKLAAYTVYYRQRFKLFDNDELQQIAVLINQCKDGEERTGIICNVVNDIPIFIHSTFAEYFATEYICDLLKTKPLQNQTSLWNFILNDMFFDCNISLLDTLDAKIKIDHELIRLFGLNKHIIFDLLLKQSLKTKSEHGYIKSSLCEAIRYNLKNLGILLISTIEDNLNQSNMMDFIEIVKETNMIVTAIKMEFEDIIKKIVSQVKIVDESKLSVLFDKFELNENYAEITTEELVHKLHMRVWKHMGIEPNWIGLELAKISGEIDFL